MCMGVCVHVDVGGCACVWVDVDVGGCACGCGWVCMCMGVCVHVDVGGCACVWVYVCMWMWVGVSCSSYVCTSEARSWYMVAMISNAVY